MVEKNTNYEITNVITGKSTMERAISCSDKADIAVDYDSFTTYPRLTEKKYLGETQYLRNYISKSSTIKYLGVVSFNHKKVYNNHISCIDNVKGDNVKLSTLVYKDSVYVANTNTL